MDGSGNVYIADTNNNAIKEYNASTQQVTTLVSSGLNTPKGVAVDGSGNVYIADTPTTPSRRAAGVCAGQRGQPWGGSGLRQSAAGAPHH